MRNEKSGKNEKKVNILALIMAAIMVVGVVGAALYYIIAH